MGARQSQPAAPAPPAAAAAVSREEQEEAPAAAPSSSSSFLPAPTVPPAQIVTSASSSASGSLSSSSSSGGSGSLLDAPTSCTRIFDQLWFCLSPVYQAREYYMTGDFDTCEEKASALYMCLANKVKKDPDIQEKIKTKLARRPLCIVRQPPADEEPDATPVWELKERPGWY